MRIIKKIWLGTTFTAVASIVGASAPAIANSNEVVEVGNPRRLVELIGVVSGESIIDVAQAINRMANQSDDQITLLINSPGGMVLAGSSIVDSIKQAQAKGISIRCVVGVIAASMAFVILNECNERIVMPNSKLLFHPMSLSMRGARVQELFILLDQMKAEEELIMKRLQSSMGLDWKAFHRHYFAETMWNGSQLDSYTKGNYLKVRNDIRGFENLYTFIKPSDLFLLETLPLPSSVKEFINVTSNGGVQ